MSGAPAGRVGAWQWWICGLLLLATTINYMDRQTLSNVAPRIKAELKLSNEQYGSVEMAFGLAFACGALLFGIIADFVSVRWLYPAVLFAWSAMGFLTGWAEGFVALFACRTFLGLFEAGHWPCALKTTQRLLPPGQRTMGNSILQSGASIGAIITPLVMVAMLTDKEGSWRFPFQLIGLAGMGWIVFWFASKPGRIFANSQTHTPSLPSATAASTNRPEVVSPTKQVRDESNPYAAPPAAAAVPDDGQPAGTTARVESSAPVPEASFWTVILSSRFAALLVMVICINLTWQLFRVWLPSFLMEGRDYAETDALFFVSAYNVATDVGCIGAGLATLLFGRLGLTVHRSRCLVFILCALLSALTTVAAVLPKGWPLFGVTMLIGCGALGLFPCYYSFSQELTIKHQGKLSGVLGFSAWAVSSPVHKYFGRLVDVTHSYDLGIALVGWAPLLGILVLMLLWGSGKKAQLSSS